MGYSGGEALVEVLRRQGVKAIFSSPGSEWGPVWEALAKFHAQGDKGPEYFNCRHETLAVSAAMGYAQKGGELPVVLLHTSAGLLNGAMAIRRAYMYQVPMVVITGDSIRFTEGKGPESGRGWQWLSRADVGGSSQLAAPFVKWRQDITSRETLAGTVARACELACMAPRGPVYLSISKEYLQEEREESLPQIPTPITCSTPDRADIEKIAELLLESQQPILITERVGIEPRAVEKLIELADMLSIPVFESLARQAVNFPREHPLHAGFDVTEAIREADLVLAVAATTPWNPQLTSPRSAARVVFIDDQAPFDRLPFWNYRADMIVAADPLPVLEALVDSLAAKRLTSPARFARMDSGKATPDQSFVSRKQITLASQEKKPIDPRWLCLSINEWLPPEAIVVLETITHTAAINGLIRRIKPGNYYRADGGGLGTGMGVALGAKLASATQPVLHLVGDGSFNYSPVLAALGFSQEYRLPVLTVVFNNGAYRAMQIAHLRIYPEGWAARNGKFYGVDISPSPDYAQLMKAFDAYGEKVEEPQEIAPALGRAWAEVEKGRSALLDVILDPGK